MLVCFCGCVCVCVCVFVFVYSFVRSFVCLVCVLVGFYLSTSDAPPVEMLLDCRREVESG